MSTPLPNKGSNKDFPSYYKSYWFFREKGYKIKTKQKIIINIWVKQAKIRLFWAFS